MRTRWKVVLGVVGGVIAVNVGLSAIQSVSGGTPGGPASSSYSTGGDGAAAYAELLSRAGYSVERPHTTPSETELDPLSTAVVLGPDFVLREDAAALRRFVRSGGRLIAGGGDVVWLRKLVPGDLRWTVEGVEESHPLAPVPEVAGVQTVEAVGEGSWSDPGVALPVLGKGDRTLAAVRSLGAGRTVLLADESPLANAYLGRADNARFGLNLAGSTARPVVFFETYHGYGSSSSVGAIPEEWQALLAFAVLATLVFVAAKWRRLGPPEPESRDLAPPRREYVEALAGTLERTRQQGEALAGLKAEALRLLVVRTGAAEPAAQNAAARRLGLETDEADALTRDGVRSEDVLPLGRALARLTGGGRKRERGGTWQG